MATLNLDTAGILDITVPQFLTFDLTIGIYLDVGLTTLDPLTGKTVQVDVRDSSENLVYRFGGTDGLGALNIVAGKAQLYVLSLILDAGTYTYSMAVKTSGGVRSQPVKGAFVVTTNHTAQA